MNNESGFTLVESLIVLTVFLMMSFLSIILLKPTHTLLEKERFFSKLTSDVLFAQQYAISHQENVRVHIMPENNNYYMRTNSKVILERNYSDVVNIKPGSLPLLFQITGNGHLNKFGYIHVEIGERVYRIMFLIGRGRFYVVEE